MRLNIHDSDLTGLPVTRVGNLTTHPEPHHLQILFLMALRSGPAPLFVEHGPTNGAVTHMFLTALKSVPDSQLVILGDVPDHVREMVDNSGIADRVSYEPPQRKPHLWFVGCPRYAHFGVAEAENTGARVVVIYDSRTTERYGLEQFTASMEAGYTLRNNPARAWNSVCDAVYGQQTRRGMLVAELKHWDPCEPMAVPQEEVLAMPAPAVVAPITPSRFKQLSVSRRS